MLQRQRDVARWAMACVVHGRWTADGGATRDPLRMYVKLCRISAHLRNMNDFSGAWALTLALTSSLVRRVVQPERRRDELARIAQAYRRPAGQGQGQGQGELDPSDDTETLLGRLVELFSPHSNFLVYRTALQHARPLGRSTPRSVGARGAVPLIDVHLHDLCMIQDTMPDTVGPNGLLNYQKVVLQAQHIRATLENQDNIFYILPIAQIMNLLKDWVLPDDKTLNEEAMRRFVR